MRKWFVPQKSFTRPEVLESLQGLANTQLDPQGLVDAMVRIAEEDNSKFRNVIPEEIIPWIKMLQEKAWVAKKDDPLMVIPES